MRKLFYITTIVISFIWLASCNKDDVIADGQAKPVITLDNPEGVYTLKIGKTAVITPTVENADEAIYSWVLDGRLVCTEPAYAYEATESGSYYLVFRVENRGGGVAEEELRIDVSEIVPPEIVFPVGEDRTLTVEANRNTVIAPSITGSEGATFEWKLDGKVVGNEATYSFNQSEQKEYELALRVENEDGAEEQTITVNVVARFEGVITFPAPYYAPGIDVPKSVALGRTIYLYPFIEHFYNPVYEWSVDGRAVTEGITLNGAMFAFTPSSKGKYTVSVKVTDDDGVSATKEVQVECFDTEGTHMRPATASSDRNWNKVYEFTAAPGQFINMGEGATAQTAIDYATARLKQTAYVSLGACGGYIVVGFDHSIENKGGLRGYDFSIKGNQFDGSSEPGIVWVMQDTNGNGEPDDEWYELKGSETGKEGTIRHYAITYYRPAAKSDVEWKDNQGQRGAVERNSYHTQTQYYPAWIKENTYTLYCTKLASNTTRDPSTGHYYNHGYEWGYADNVGSDNDAAAEAGSSRKVYFKIANAINSDGSDANLKYIDFIKVQTAVTYVNKTLGEISTEVFGFEDENI